MGICSSNKSKSNTNIRVYNKKRDFNNYSKFISQNSFSKINKSLCKVIVKSNSNNSYELGFFVNIQINENKKCLITNSLDLTQDLIDKKEEIKIQLETEKTIKIKLDGEKRFIENIKQPFNITIIELLDSDLFSNEIEFLNYEDLEFNLNSENILNKDIFIIPYSLNDKNMKKGKILKIINFGFEHSINYNDVCMGNLIISVENQKIIGINNNNNSGIFIGEIIKQLEINKKENKNCQDLKESSISKNNICENNEIIMKYSIDKEKKIKLLGNKFIENNINNCKLIINNKEKELCEYIEPTKIIDKENDNTFIIKLKLINTLTNISHMFAECKNLVSILNITNLNTAKITAMNNLFFGCENLLYIPDISSWDTSKVENMGDLFSGCSLINILPDLSNWNTSNVKNMSYMFSGCECLSIFSDISKWNTSNVTNFSYMFHWCKALTYLPDISKWDTSNAIDMSWMFSDCSSLEMLPNLGKWKIKNVMDMNHMFFGCSSLTTLPDISKWDTSQVKDMSYMFSGCSNLKTFPKINDWNKTNLKDIRHMFQGCKKYPEIKIKHTN